MNKTRPYARILIGKAGRDQNMVHKALAAIDDAARAEENLMRYIIDTVRVYASTGEICRSLQEVFGKYTASSH